MLREYEESGDPDIAAHIIDSLEASRRHRWEAAMEQLDFTHSSRKGWNLLRKLGAAQRPPATKHYPVSANQVASHLVNVAKAPLSKPVRERFMMNGDSLTAHGPLVVILFPSQYRSWMVSWIQ